uniref:Uncharacterized protein n=1 Tax=Manihot esculenta TaxID=3983 RepID=A0A2C9WAC3_MANES
MLSPIFLQLPRTISDQLRTRIFARLMGGGPRTFPGGLNKWQWKRLHEKRAREKEKRLLDQEKQLYQARIRSQLRARLAGKPDLDPNSDTDTSYGPMTPKDQIKALADRFMTEGAEDLWNENDGPLKTPSPKSIERPRSIGLNQRPGSINSPIDLRKLMLEARNESHNCQSFSKDYNYIKARDYSVQRCSYNMAFSSSSSSDDEDENYGFDSFNEGERQGEIWNGAALRKYDTKITKRVPLKELEKESDFASWLKMMENRVRQARKNRFSVREGEGFHVKD